MTQIDPAAISPEDIDDLDDGAPVARAETATFRPRLREAVREDLASGRAWARSRAGRAEATIRDKPLQSTAWALVVGLVLGVVLTR